MVARHLIILAALAGSTLPTLPTLAADRPADGAASIMVDLDNARVLRMPRPAATVIIGNPAIADVSVQDASTMVLTGRSYGSTNLIVLDGNGEAMIDRQVSVRSSEAGTVRIFRQEQRQTVSCSPQCEPTVTIGDTVNGFALTAQQVTDRQKLALQPTAEKSRE